MRHIALIASAILIAPHAMAQEHDHSNHTEQPPAPQQPTEDHSAHADHSNHATTDQMPTDHSAHGAGHAAMPSALGPYAMSRDASGTAWQPDAASHGGLHYELGSGWSSMVHATLDGVYSWQDGPRGDEKVFGAGMIMASLRGPAGPGTLQLRGMVSPDPLMGKSGYPLLLAAGETADGVNTLTDRQHPHDFFMELSASYSLALSNTDSVFVYAGLPGEPAFGPPAFMHRPRRDDEPRSAHHAPLAGFNAHHLRRPHRRLGA